MKTAILSFFCFFITYTCLSQDDINSLIKEAGRLESIPDEGAAFNKFKEVLKLQPANIHALNKCSELCSRIGKRQIDKSAANEYYHAAIIYAATALKMDAANSESNCAMAIALGSNALNKGGKEKIAAARQIKKYVDIAIQNNPQNFKAWHVLGRWNFELSMLNIIERTAASVLYGNIPVGTISAAIAAFEKVNSITDGFILNYFELARAYKKNDEDVKAVSALNKMLLLPNKTEDDAVIKKNGERMLKELQ